MTRRNALLVAGVALAVLVTATPVGAAPAVGSQFAGMWVSTDPGDGSTQTLQVSAGDTPRVTYQDFFASACERNGSPSTHWVMAGRGRVTANTLEIEFHKTGCGWFTIGGYDASYEYDPGTDTLLDSDLTIYVRA